MELTRKMIAYVQTLMLSMDYMRESKRIKQSAKNEIPVRVARLEKIENYLIQRYNRD